MGKPHILVVDDDVYIIEALQTYLELLGYRVSHAYGCEQAKARLRTTDKVDLMILDYLLPDGSGVDLLQALSSDTSLQRPPVIMSSGVLDPKTPVWEQLRKRLHKDSQLLIQAYVSKPYTLDAMDVALQEVLGGDYIPSPRATRRQAKAKETP